MWKRKCCSSFYILISGSGCFFLLIRIQIRHAKVMQTDAVKALKELRQCCVYNNEVKSKICNKKENPHQIVYSVTGAICCYSCRAFFRRSCHRHTTNQIWALVAAVANQSLGIAAEQFSVIVDTGRKQIRAGTLWQNCFHQWLPQTHTDDKSLHCAANNFLQWFPLARNQLEVWHCGHLMNAETLRLISIP